MKLYQAPVTISPWYDRNPTNTVLNSIHELVGTSFLAVGTVYTCPVNRKAFVGLVSLKATVGTNMAGLSEIVLGFKAVTTSQGAVNVYALSGYWQYSMSTFIYTDNLHFRLLAGETFNLAATNQLSGGNVLADSTFIIHEYDA